MTAPVTVSQESDLYRLLYTSRCTMEGSERERLSKVREIASASSANNVPAALTGSLLFIDGSFVQVLEGPAAELEAAFERICCDFRHDTVRLIDLVPVKERLFDKWDMAFLEGDTEQSIALRGDLQEIHFLVGVNAREAVKQMRSLLDYAVA